MGLAWLFLRQLSVNQQSVNTRQISRTATHKMSFTFATNISKLYHICANGISCRFPSCEVEGLYKFPFRVRKV